MDEALRQYEMIALSRPKSAMAQYNLGFIYQKLGQHDDARRSFERSLALDEDYAPAKVALGALK